MFFQAILYGNPDYYPPMINGAVVLANNGIEQQILCGDFYSPFFPEGPAEYPPATHIARISLRAKRIGGKYASFLAQTLRQGDPKAAFFIGYDMHGLLPARLLATRYHRPLVYHSHDFVGPGQKLTKGQQIVKLFEQIFARTADMVIVPDRDRAAFMVGRLGLRKSPIVVANAPINAPHQSNQALQRALEERGRHFERIVFRPGHIGDGHALKRTIRSIPLWSNPNWGFVIMGPGEESYKQSLSQLAESVGVQDKFEILPSVNYKEVSQYTIEAHLGHGLYEPLHFSHLFFTTASNKIMEYMAAGLPLLLSDSTGSRAILEKYCNGIAVTVDSVESIAAGVNSVLSNREMAEIMSRGSQRAFVEEFNYARQYAPAIAMFRELAAR